MPPSSRSDAGRVKRAALTTLPTAGVLSEPLEVSPAMKLFRSLFAATLFLLVADIAHADSPMETIGPEGALENIEKRDGVVFVDLFADW